MMSRGRRLVIYFFFDKDGIADRYVDYFLNGLSEVTDKFIIVANGKITPDSRKLFLKYTEDIIVRKNEGLDAWAYKEALEYEGWDQLRQYYEVCLVNSTIMGPVYPFSDMFDKMSENEDLDFWGITRHLKIDFDPFNCNPYGYVPEHIQSHFVVYRNKFLKDRNLEKYWNNLPLIKNYSDSVGKHESYFTKYFSDQGYVWDSYIKDDDIETCYDRHLIINNPALALSVLKCPIFKRRSFFHEYRNYLQYQMGEPAVELLKYLKKNTNYNINYIFENIIRTCNQYDFVRNMGLTYILPTNNILSNNSNSKVALIMHLYYEDCIGESLHYALSMPEEADIYINTPHSNLVDTISSYFSVLKNKVNINIIENRGRDVSSLLTGAYEVVGNYDLICFYHDKKVTQIKPGSVGKSFAYKVNESALSSKEYVKNIIHTFEENAFLGLLTNTPPHHGDYHGIFGNEWGPNYETTISVYKKLNLNVDIDRSKPPVAPLGTVFWFRSSALKKLFDVKWKYSDFPQEPNGIDGTLLHAIERIYPFVVQDAGYYPAYVMPDCLATIEINDYLEYLRGYVGIMHNNCIYGTFYQKEYLLGLRLRSEVPGMGFLGKTYEKIKLLLKKILPKSLYLKLRNFIKGNQL